MNLLKGIGTGLCLIVLCVLAAPKAKADEWNQKTIVTFSAPVEVPGVGQHILPAGTYVFKLMNSLSDRNIVQILNVREDPCVHHHSCHPELSVEGYRQNGDDFS